MPPLASVDEVLTALASGGASAYFGEPVTVLEHSLQAAYFIQRKYGSHPGSETLIAAALLHDIGHLLHTDGEDAAGHGLDTRHEELAGEALDGHFPIAVLHPIQLHVAAKRYLCHAEPRYFHSLSPASVESLALQGSPMTAEEAVAFLALPHAADAIALRRADDAAKVEDLAVPTLETYRPLLVSLWS